MIAGDSMIAGNNMSARSGKIFRITLRLLALLATLACLAACTLENIAARQEKASQLWPELVDGESYGQTFVSQRANLYRIDLGTATYMRVNSAEVIFHLRADPTAAEDLATRIIPAAEIQNDRPTSITFPPLPDSQQRSYYFFLESPEAHPGNAVTVYANEYDQYPDGTAFRGGQAVDGDLVFTAYSQETFSPGDVLSVFWGRLRQDAPFAALYGLMLLGVIVQCCRAFLKPNSNDQN